MNAVLDLWCYILEVFRIPKVYRAVYGTFLLIWKILIHSRLITSFRTWAWAGCSGNEPMKTQHKGHRRYVSKPSQIKLHYYTVSDAITSQKIKCVLLL